MLKQQLSAARNSSRNCSPRPAGIRSTGSIRFGSMGPNTWLLTRSAKPAESRTRGPEWSSPTRTSFSSPRCEQAALPGFANFATAEPDGQRYIVNESVREIRQQFRFQAVEPRAERCSSAPNSRPSRRLRHEVQP